MAPDRVVSQDPRFRTDKDPRFRRMPWKHRKLQLDSRFHRLWSDSRFGRWIRQTTAIPEGMLQRRTPSPLRDNTNLHTDAISEPLPKQDTLSPFPSETSNVEEQALRPYLDEPIKDIQNPQLGQATYRLSLLGCDWDSITAADILNALQSLFPNDSRKKIKRVSIYPSELGIKEAAEEEKRLKHIDSITNDNSDLSPALDSKGTVLDTTNSVLSLARPAFLDGKGPDADDEEKKQEQLRAYQIRRSYFCYAILECETTQDAINIYDEADGMDAPFSIDSIDLRFVPDDVVFPHKPLSVSESVSDSFMPAESFRSSLRHSKAQCTWDETTPARKKLLMRRFTADDIQNLDLDAYLASESDSDAETANGKDKIQAIQSFLGDLSISSTSATHQSKEEGLSFDIEFTPGNLESQTQKDETSESLDSTNNSKSVWENFLEKDAQRKKNKRQLRKARLEAMNNQHASHQETSETIDTSELDLLTYDTDEKKRKHFDIHSKKRSPTDLFKVDTDDPRLKRVFSDAQFAIDPTHPKYQKTEANEQILSERRKRVASLRKNQIL